MNLEQQITEDAELCAKNFWWEAHDAGDFSGTAIRFHKQEVIIARYAKTRPSEEATKYFLDALSAYDKFTEALKGSHAVDNGAISGNLELMYDALGVKNETYSYTHNWWINFAFVRLDEKRGRMNKNRLTLVFQNLLDEHIERFGFDQDTATGLASLMMSAAYLGHNTRDWKKTERLLKVYYTELFSALAKK